MTTHRFRRLHVCLFATGIALLSFSLRAQVVSNPTTSDPTPSPSATKSGSSNSHAAAPIHAGTAADGDIVQPQKATPASAPQSQQDQAEQQLKQQEHQRILGIIPNFNTTNLQNAAPLSPKQKFHLAFRSAIDPFQFVASGALAGFGQARDDDPGYGQGVEGYAQRYGASYADSADGVLWGNAIYPVLLHEDPRYFRKGSGSFRARFLYAISTTVWTKNDNGTWGPNYANVLGNLTAGGISNLYYPSTNRGIGLTFEGAATVTAEGALGALGVEFWPDISRKLFHKQDRAPAAPAPK